MPTNQMNQENIIRAIYDVPSNSISVNIVGSGTPTMPNVVRLSDGIDFITTTDIGPKVALDVAIQNMPEVIISDTDDSIKIGNGSGTFLGVNPDGSINVNVTSSGTNNIIFNSISSVASGFNTLLQSYTVGVGKTDLLQQIEVSGTNIAQYEVYLNSSIIARKYTFFGNSLNETFDFNNFKLNSGDNIQIKVLHNRNSLGDFNSRIQFNES